MTQRVFDVENEKDMQDLWNILPDNIVKIKQRFQDGSGIVYYTTNGSCVFDGMKIININWHDKTEITRPIQEATGTDIGKLCRFWNDKGEEFFGRLGRIGDKYFTMIAPVYEDIQFLHCRRLIKQEIEELC